MKLQQKNIDDVIPFLQLFVDEVEDAREETLQRNKRLNLKIFISVILIIALIGGFIGITKLDLYDRVIDFYKFASVLGIFIITFFIKNSYSKKNKFQKEYEKTFMSELYSIIISTIRPSWSYEADFRFNKNDLIESDIFSGRVKIKNIDYCLKGEFDLFPMEVYKIHAKMNNDEQSNSVTNYLGLFLKITLANTTNNRAIVAPRITFQSFNSNSFHKLNLHQKGYEIHSDNDLTFNRYFKTYNTQNYDFPEMLTPTFQRQLAYFISNHKKEVYLSFQKDKLYISIKTDELTELPSLNGGVSTKHAAEHFYNELQIALDLLKRMEIDTRDGK